MAEQASLQAGHELTSHELTHAAGLDDPAAHVASSGPVASLVRNALNGVDAVCRAVLVAALVIELSIVLTEIGSRFWFHQSLLWSDEAAKCFCR